MEGTEQGLLEGTEGSCAEHCCAPLDTETIREVFETFDISGDGEISYSELKSAIRSISPDMRSAEIKDLFLKADVDRKNGISFQEFEAVIRQVGRDILGDSQSFIVSVTKAAEHILEAFLGEERPGLKNCVRARRFHKIMLRGNWVKQTAALILVLLTFVEMPVYCLNASVNHGHSECSANSDMYPSFGLPMLRPSQAAFVNAPCLLVLSVHVVLQSKAFGWRVLWEITRHRLEIIMLLTLWLNAGYELLAEASSQVVGVSVEPVVRLVYCVLLSRELSVTFVHLFKILPKFLEIVALVGLFLVMYTAMGCMLFPPSTPEGNMYFNTYWDGLWNMLILLTTANNPDVMMPAYNEHRAAALYFVSFVLVGIFFLLSFMLAVVFNLYSEQVAQASAELHRFREEKLAAAFHLLRHKAKTYIPEPTTIAVFKELFKYKSHAAPSTEVLDVMFAVLDSTGDKRIYQHEFAKLCTLMQLQFDRLEPPWIERQLPWLAESAPWQRLRSCRTVARLNLGVDLVLVLMFGLCVAYGCRDGWDEESDAVKVAGWVVLLLMSCEQVLKVLTRGFAYFWRTPLNRFDSIMTLAALCTFVLVNVPSLPMVSGRYLVAVLLVRMVRLMRHVPAWNLLLEVVSAGQRPALRLGCVLLSIMFLFGSVGIALFGGKINRDPASEYFQRIQDTSFAQSEYWANNFNDMASAMLTLFALIVVNNWFVIVDGVVAVTSPWAKLYFICFWVIGVVFFFNLVVGFVLDVFHSEYVATRKVCAIPGGKVAFKNGMPVSVFEVEEVLSASETAGEKLSRSTSGSYKGKTEELSGRYLANLRPNSNFRNYGGGGSAQQAFVDLFKREPLPAEELGSPPSTRSELEQALKEGEGHPPEVEVLVPQTLSPDPLKSVDHEWV